MYQSIKILGSLTLALGLFSCSHTRNISSEKNLPSLKQTFKSDFLIGTALDSVQNLPTNEKEAQLIPYQFDAMTPENAMKAENIHPEWGRYYFDQADKIVDYAQQHGIKLNGHTLIWHSQLPAFVHQIQSADSLRMFFTEHIRTLASRYNGKIDSWDVVNEALNEDGTLRKSIFLDKLGDDFIVEAFRLAQQYAPDTKLYYNDYNIEQPQKRAGAIRIIKQIQAAGVRIDGVGIQGHWNIRSLPFDAIEKSIQEFSALGMEVMFTELDLGVLPNPWDSDGAEISHTAGYSEKMDPYKNGLPDSVAQLQAQQYEKLFNLFLKYKDDISRVTFWGVNDGQSWLNGWPIPDRTNYPLLFDRQFNPKPAFYKVIETGKSK